MRDVHENTSRVPEGDAGGSGVAPARHTTILVTKADHVSGRYAKVELRLYKSGDACLPRRDPSLKNLISYYLDETAPTSPCASIESVPKQMADHRTKTPAFLIPADGSLSALNPGHRMTEMRVLTKSKT
jgi:hypothetical protein